MSSSSSAALRLRVEEVDHRCIAPGQRAQRQVVIRIRQRAHVEHEVGVERHAELERERFEQQRQRRAFDLDQFLDPGAQLVGATARRCRSRGRGLRSPTSISRSCRMHSIRVGAIGRTSRPGAAVRQRMAAAGFGKTRDQRLGLCGQEQHLTSWPCSLAARGCRPAARQRLGAAGIDRDRQRLRAFASDGWRPVAGSSVGGRLSTQIVARVFEAFSRDRFAGARDAGDENDAHGAMIPQ